MKFIKQFVPLLILLFGAPSVFAQDYYVYVAAESEDEVHLVHFNAENQKAEISETISVGRFPTEIDGPHGIAISPDGKYWFVSLAHGNPYGILAKYDTETNTLQGTVELGMFPASMDISPLTGLLYIVNFDLHGEMVPSTVSVVETESMTNVTDIPTGIMPHGSRVNSTGKYMYHVSMMTDELIEISTQNLEVTRRLKLSKEGSSAMNASMSGHEGMDHGNHLMKHNPVEKPTWAHPHPQKPLVYVAANGSDEILEIDTEAWKVTRRFDTAKAPYNLDVSPDGKLLVVSYKGAGATGIWDLKTGKELAKINNSRKVTHGVAISDDSKYAFISVEGVGGEPGSVEVLNLESLETVDVVETGKQAGGIYFWKQK
ncbi:MAG: YncE family protein [Balneolaceae bacterium]